MQKFVVIISLLFVCICNSYSQQEYLNTRISYNATDIPLEQVLKDIEKQTSIRFTFNSAIISDNEKITISIQNKTLNEVLPLILKGKYVYKLIGNQILIYEPIKTKTTQTKTQNKPNPSKSTKQKIDTIRVYDTITIVHVDSIKTIYYDTVSVYDTITINEQIIKSKNSNNLHISFLSGQRLSIPFTTNAITTKYKDILSNSNSVDWSATQSIRVLYNKQNLIVGTGIQHIPLRYETQYNSTQIVDDTTHTYTDTLWYWKYNKLFTYYKFNTEGDSIGIDVYDSTFTYKLEENPKKIEKTTTINSSALIRYLAIPLSIGYEFDINPRITCRPLFNLQTLIVLYRKGLISGINEDIINIKDLPIKHINYGLGVSCVTSYQITQDFSISINPFLSILPNIYSRSNIFQQTFTTVGMEWGITYSIPYDIF